VDYCCSGNLDDSLEKERHIMCAMSFNFIVPDEVADNFRRRKGTNYCN